MPFIGIRISELRKQEPSAFVIKYRHRDFGSGWIVLDEETLRPVEREVAVDADEYPKDLLKPTIAFEGMGVKLAGDAGEADGPDTKYVLRWETLSANYDRPRKPPLPPASALKLLKLQRTK